MGGGYDALVYRKALAFEMRLINMEVIENFSCPIVYDGDVELGVISFDMVVDQRFMFSITTEPEFNMREENRLKRFLEAANKPERFPVIVSSAGAKVLTVVV